MPFSKAPGAKAAATRPIRTAAKTAARPTLAEKKAAAAEAAAAEALKNKVKYNMRQAPPHVKEAVAKAKAEGTYAAMFEQLAHFTPKSGNWDEFVLDVTNERSAQHGTISFHAR